MKRFVAALALTCVLSSVALAGHIDTCGLTADEPTTTETASPGDIPATGYAASDGTSQTPADEKLATGIGILLTALGLVF